MQHRHLKIGTDGFFSVEFFIERSRPHIKQDINPAFPGIDNHCIRRGRHQRVRMDEIVVQRNAERVRIRKVYGFSVIQKSEFESLPRAVKKLRFVHCRQRDHPSRIRHFLCVNIYCQLHCFSLLFQLRVKS